jgi:hypothetical protein
VTSDLVTDLLVFAERLELDATAIGVLVERLQRWPALMAQLQVERHALERLLHGRSN